MKVAIVGAGHIGGRAVGCSDQRPRRDQVNV